MIGMVGMPVHDDRTEAGKSEGVDPERARLELAGLRLAVRGRGPGAGAAGADNQRREHDRMPRAHLTSMPRKPPEIRAATCVSIRGRATPPGDATYRGSQIGLNFALYSRRPWKL